jgi:class 3 adenylate cyclase
LKGSGRLVGDAVLVPRRHLWAQWSATRHRLCDRGAQRPVGLPVGPGAEHGRHQVPQPPGQAREAGHPVGGGLDVGDPGSPEPFELGAHGRPVVSCGQQLGQYQGVLQRHRRTLRPHRPGGMGGVADQDQPAATPTLATDLLHRRVVQLAGVVQHRGAILPLLSAFYAYDLVEVFPAVRVPTLVLHRRDDALVPVRHGRQIASQIPDARFVELEGADHLPFVGDAEAVLAEVQDFLVGSRTPIPRQRRLLTLVFTDIADATPKAVDLGDDIWREVLAAHDRDVRTHLTRFGGEEIKRLDNGVLAVFDGPARAIRCALGIVEAAEPKGLAVRVGVHTGECELVEADVRGIAVHVGARILELAAPGQILVSSTVRDLVAGSGIRFGEGRDVQLAGMPGTATVFPVLRHGASPEAVRRSAVEQTNLFRRDGEYWTVGHRGLVVTVRDRPEPNLRKSRGSTANTSPPRRLGRSSWPVAIRSGRQRGGYSRLVRPDCCPRRRLASGRRKRAASSLPWIGGQAPC